MNTLKKEYLHVPLYGWLAGVGALVLGILYFRNHKSTGVSTATLPVTVGSAPSSGQTMGSGTIGGGTVGGSTGGTTAGDGTNPGSTGVSPPPTSTFNPTNLFETWFGGNYPNVKPGPTSTFDAWMSSVIGQFIKSTGQQFPGGVSQAAGTGAFTPKDSGEYTFFLNEWQKVQHNPVAPAGGPIVNPFNDPSVHHPPGPIPNPFMPVGGRGGGAAAVMQPFPIAPGSWTPKMNSDIFSPPAGGSSPVAPVVPWPSTPGQNLQ